MEPGISVIVICRNEREYLPECLRSIAKAAAGSSLPVEVLIVDGASTDGTADLADDWVKNGIDGRVLRCARAGYSYQRNAGVTAARHPWIAFLSADVRVGPDWLAELDPVLAGDEHDLIIGKFDLVTPAGHRPWLAALARTIYPTRSANETVERCSTVHLVARREALLAVPFDERLPACEDKDLAFRLQQLPQWRGAYYSAHRPAHVAREGVGEFLAKLGREAYAVGFLSRVHGPDFPDCFGWRRFTLRAAAILGMTAVTSLALPASRRLRSTTALAGVAWSTRYAEGWRRHDPGQPWPTQAGLHAAAMAVISANWIRGWLAGAAPQGANHA